MKIRVRFFLLLFVSALASPLFSGADEPESLSVEEAVKLVLAHNHSLQEAADAVAIFQAKVEQSRSGLFPNVRADLSYTRLGPLSEISIPGLGSFELYPANNYDMHAALRQNLYDFNRTREGINLARSQIRTVEDRWLLLKRDLEYQTAQLFYTILLLRENIRVKEEHIRMLNEHLEISRRKVQSGTATELEVLTTQVRVVTAQSQELNLENTLAKEVIALQRLIGRPEKKALQLRGELSYQALALNAAELVASAWQKRPEMRAVKDIRQSAAIQFHLAGLHDRPALNLDLLAGTRNGYFPDLNQLKLNFVLSVQADIPIFNGNLTRYLKAEARANLKTIEDRSREIEEMIRAEVLQAVSDVQTGEKELQLVEVNIEQARKAREFAKARYQAGTVTNLDLIDAEEAYSEAEWVKLQALYKCVISQLALQRAVGNNLILK